MALPCLEVGHKDCKLERTECGGCMSRMDTAFFFVREIRGHLQTKIFTLNVIVTLKGGGGGGSLANEHDINF